MIFLWFYILYLFNMLCYPYTAQVCVCVCEQSCTCNCTANFYNTQMLTICLVHVLTLQELQIPPFFNMS